MSDPRRRLIDLSSLAPSFATAFTSRDEHESSQGDRCCRACGSNDLSRSRTRWFEQWLKPLRNARPYRCRVCEWRGWV